MPRPFNGTGPGTTGPGTTATTATATDGATAGAVARGWREVLPGASRRSFLAVVGAGSLAALLAACGPGDAGSGDTRSGGGKATGPAKKGGILRVGTPPPPTSVDPVTAYDGSAIAVIQLVADYLVWLDKDFGLQPRLATSWTSNEDATAWTFTLREGVTFSDGTALDAQTVKASFDRLLDPRNKSAALSAFGDVLAQGGVAAPDGSTVVFTLRRPYVDFPYLVSAGNYNTVILKKDYKGDFTKPASAIGTGPFVLTSYDASKGASFVRNTRYWNTGRPYLDGVEVTFYRDEQADVAALQSGDIDTQFLSRAQLVKPLSGTGNLAVDEVKSTNLTLFTLRTDRAPFDRKEVRQAVAYALDRPALRTGVGGGSGQLGNDHLFAPAYPTAPKDIPQRAQDRKKVEELLASAGVSGLRFTLTFDEPGKDYAVAVQSQLKEFGITVDLDQQSSAKFYGGDQKKDTPWLFATATLVGYAGRPVPSQLVAPVVTSGAVWNGAKYSNPEVDRAAKAYDATKDEKQRAVQAHIIAEALHEDVPVIVSYWGGAVRAYNSTRFTGIEAHPSQFVDFSGVSRL